MVMMVMVMVVRVMTDSNAEAIAEALPDRLGRRGCVVVVVHMQVVIHKNQYVRAWTLIALRLCTRACILIMTQLSWHRTQRVREGSSYVHTEAQIQN